MRLKQLTHNFLPRFERVVFPRRVPSLAHRSIDGYWTTGRPGHAGATYRVVCPSAALRRRMFPLAGAQAGIDDPHSVDLATLAVAVVASLADPLQRLFSGIERRRYVAGRVCS
jgi:hypothetical protein